MTILADLLVVEVVKKSTLSVNVAILAPRVVFSSTVSSIKP
jgi:hypothetical protein